jgi:hypothetical protein
LVEETGSYSRKGAEPVLEAVRSDAKCHGLRVDGEPCRSTIVAMSGYCYTHDPSVVEARTAARRRGGAASSKVHRARKLAPPLLRDVFDVLMKALEEVHSGVLEPQRAQAMASVARAAVSTLTAGELEQRIRDLEEMMI